MLDRLGLNSNAYRVEDPSHCVEGDVPVGFDFAEDQIHPGDGALG